MLLRFKIMYYLYCFFEIADKVFIHSFIYYSLSLSLSFSAIHEQ